MMQPTDAKFEFPRPQGKKLVRLKTQAEHYFRAERGAASEIEWRKLAKPA
jgi:hypothetical protein